MWRKIPLNSKLIILLLFVHVLFYSIAAESLIRWNDSTRMNELRHRLDIQADFVEDVIEIGATGLALNPNSEIRRELDHERDTYFLVMDPDKAIIDESKGPPIDTIQQIRNKLFQSVPAEDESYLIQINQDSWLVQSENIERTLAGKTSRATIHVAIHIQSVLDGISRFKKMIVITSMIFSMLASLATGVVVSYTTRNLRKFAQTLRTNNPMNSNAAVEFHFRPLSLEESLLYESYHTMTSQVKKTAESQRLFIAHASHELKTPIATALVVTELSLSRPRSNAEYEQAHKEVFEELKILKRLSTTLLDFASLEQANFDYRRTGTCDLCDVLEVVVERWMSLAESKSITLRIHPSASVRVHGIAELWETVFSNLVENAIKYGKPQGRVDLQTEIEEPGTVAVIVEDNGIGMAEEDLSRMGEVFFKADSSRSTVGSFGLGFAHAQRIVKRLGGNLSIQSQAGVGTKVVVSLSRIS